MPRLTMVDPASDSGPGAQLLNGSFKDKQINIFKGMATNPEVLKAFASFSQRIKNVLSPREHEIVALAASQRNNCDYCLAAHTKVAEAVGIDEKTSLRIRRGEADDAKDQALIDFVLAVLDTSGYVSGEELDAFRAAGYDDAAVIETLAQIAASTFTNLFNHVNETEVDFPAAAAV